MNFKDVLKEDVTTAFFCEGEFAGRNDGHPHTWDGLPVNAIVDQNELELRFGAEYQSFPAGTILVFIPASEIATPVYGSAHRFDGAAMTVWNVSEEMGLYAVVLMTGSIR
jgi:hypothetical protein